MNSKHTQAQMEYMVSHPGRYLFFTRDTQRTLRQIHNTFPNVTILHQKSWVVIGKNHYIQVLDVVDDSIRGVEIANYWVDESAQISQADIAWLESRVR